TGSMGTTGTMGTGNSGGGSTTTGGSPMGEPPTGGSCVGATGGGATSSGSGLVTGGGSLSVFSSITGISIEWDERGSETARVIALVVLSLKDVLSARKLFSEEFASVIRS